jgi:thymidine kinase
MAKLKFKYGTMRSGKSVHALQINHAYKNVGQFGLLFTAGDHSGKEQITSRIGLSQPAIESDESFDFYLYVQGYVSGSAWVDYIIVDEAQFLTPKQVDELAEIVDEYGINVHAFGIKVDFKGQLFDGVKRLFEVSDECSEIETKSLCWCGKKAIHNVRVNALDGELILEGSQVQKGDNYETLCRSHVREGLTWQKVKLKKTYVR